MINRKILALSLLFSQVILGQTELNEKDQVEKEIDTLEVENETQINPWQQSKGEVLIVPFINYYSAQSFRDSSGDRSDFSNNGKFSNSNPRIYVAAPLLSHKINIVSSIPYFFNRYEDDQINDTNNDLGDIELGLKFHLASFKDNHLMVTLLSILPAYTNDPGDEPFTGFEQFGLESRIILAGTMNYFGNYKDFHKVELGLRHFFPNDPTQIRFLISEGYNVTDKFQVIGELDGIFSYSNRDDFFQENLQLVSEFNVIKASINLGYKFSKPFSVYAGLFQDIYNRNSAIGRGVQFSMVIRVN